MLDEKITRNDVVQHRTQSQITQPKPLHLKYLKKRQIHRAITYKNDTLDLRLGSMLYFVLKWECRLL